MVSWENLVFDPTLYGLSAVLLSVLFYTFITGLRSSKSVKKPDDGSSLIGTGFVALGTMISIAGSIFLLVLLRSSIIGGIFYQQVQFAIGYLGTGVILYGLQRIVFPNQLGSLSKLSSSSRPRLTVLIWIVFLGSVILSGAFLLNPSTYSTSQSEGTQHVPQQTIFWLPVLVTMAIGLTGILAKRIRLENRGLSLSSLWLFLFFVSALIGILKESNIIPTLGDPFADLLVAFIPFTLASIFIYASARTLKSWLGHPTSEASDFIPSGSS